MATRYNRHGWIPGKASESECRSCGASIPAGQTKCRFCLAKHLDVQDTLSPERDYLHIIHVLVKSRTFYGAVAKEPAAPSLLAKSNSDPAIDDYQLLYDLDE